MRILVVHNPRLVWTKDPTKAERGAQLYHALQRRGHEVGWISGSLRFLETMDSQNAIAAYQVTPEDTSKQPQIVRLGMDAFDAAFVDGSVEIEGECQRHLLHSGPSGANVVDAFNHRGKLCVGFSASDHMRDSFAKAGALEYFVGDEVLDKLASTVKELTRLHTDEQPHPTRLPALTLRQPMAWAVLHAFKNIENRVWPTGVRGQIVIHSSESEPDGYFDWASRFISERIPPRSVLKVPQSQDLPRGALVGVVNVDDCIKKSSSPWWEGPIGFKLSDARALSKPIPCAGKRRFFRLTAALSRKVENILAP